MKIFNELKSRKKVNIDEIFELFDSLESLQLKDMHGIWKGYEITTGHRLDGVLENSGWYGKSFVNNENVFPLLMQTRWQKKPVAIDPAWIPMSFPLPKFKYTYLLTLLFLPILKSKNSSARLRMVEYRGKITATMIYDKKPIYDHFAKIDDNRILGIMDQKGESQPFAFLLEKI